MTATTCREVTELVTDAMEGVLPAETLARFEDHLERCEDCRTFALQMSQTVDVLRRLRQPL